jgi:hypothetical protein
LIVEKTRISIHTKQSFDSVTLFEKMETKTLFGSRPSQEKLLHRCSWLDCVVLVGCFSNLVYTLIGFHEPLSVFYTHFTAYESSMWTGQLCKLSANGTITDDCTTINPPWAATCTATQALAVAGCCLAALALLSGWIPVFWRPWRSVTRDALRACGLHDLRPLLLENLVGILSAVLTFSSIMCWSFGCEKAWIAEYLTDVAYDRRATDWFMAFFVVNALLLALAVIFFLCIIYQRPPQQHSVYFADETKTCSDARGTKYDGASSGSSIVTVELI